MWKKLRSYLGGTEREVGAASAAGEFTTTQAQEGAGSAPLINMSGVSKVFVADKIETDALKDINLKIERGEFIAVNGPSGSGKSTLLSIMGLLETQTDGTYILNGVDVSTLSASSRAAARNREVGFIFQSFNLIGDLNVFENIELPLTYLGLARAERRERVMEALERVDMADRVKQMPSHLSGGHQQRVAVARAVVGKPEILLADEPTGNLNSSQAKAVIELLVELHDSGSTICLVSHDPRWRSVTGRALELFDGTIVG